MLKATILKVARGSQGFPKPFQGVETKVIVTTLLKHYLLFLCFHFHKKNNADSNYCSLYSAADQTVRGHCLFTLSHFRFLKAMLA